MRSSWRLLRPFQKKILPGRPILKDWLPASSAARQHFLPENIVDSGIAFWRRRHFTKRIRSMVWKRKMEGPRFLARWRNRVTSWTYILLTSKYEVPVIQLGGRGATVTGHWPAEHLTNVSTKDSPWLITLQRGWRRVGNHVSRHGPFCMLNVAAWVRLLLLRRVRSTQDRGSIPVTRNSVLNIPVTQKSQYIPGICPSQTDR